MRKVIVFIIGLMLIQYSCITDQRKYKETDVFEEYEAENGFTILHLPPVLFKIILSAADDEEINSKELLNKIDVIKLMFFEEKENTQQMLGLKTSMNGKVKDFNYNLLTKIAEENNDISIYIIEHEKTIKEVLVTIISDKQYIGVNLVGTLTKDDVMNVYKTINMQKMKEFSN